MTVHYEVRFPVDDRDLSTLHALAFESALEVQQWAERLERWALTWVGAFSNDQLVGFVQVCWDGGAHAFVLDTAVHPDYGRQGIGKQLVLTAAEEAKAAGCEWLHVDYEPHLTGLLRGRVRLPSDGCRAAQTPIAVRRSVEMQEVRQRSFWSPSRSAVHRVNPPSPRPSPSRSMPSAVPE